MVEVPASLIASTGHSEEVAESERRRTPVNKAPNSNKQIPNQIPNHKIPKSLHHSYSYSLFLCSLFIPAAPAYVYCVLCLCCFNFSL